MPKVYLTENERRVARLSNYIFGAIKSNGTTQIEIADELGITRQLFARKVRKGSLTYTELYKVFRILGTDEKTVLNLLT